MYIRDYINDTMVIRALDLDMRNECFCYKKKAED
jgi:hypothetical protein